MIRNGKIRLKKGEVNQKIINFVSSALVINYNCHNKVLWGQKLGVRGEYTWGVVQKKQVEIQKGEGA